MCTEPSGPPRPISLATRAASAGSPMPISVRHDATISFPALSSACRSRSPARRAALVSCRCWSRCAALRLRSRRRLTASVSALPLETAWKDMAGRFFQKLQSARRERVSGTNIMRSCAELPAAPVRQRKPARPRAACAIADHQVVSARAKAASAPPGYRALPPLDDPLLAARPRSVVRPWLVFHHKYSSLGSWGRHGLGFLNCRPALAGRPRESTGSSTMNLAPAPL